MRFEVNETLTEEELEAGLRRVIKDGLAAQTMVTLTGGAFLVAFALLLGAPNLVIGLLAAIPPLAQLLQIPAIYLVEKYRSRRTICVYMVILSRSFWVLIALIPLFVAGGRGLTLLIGAFFFYAAFGAVSSSSWNSWMRDLVPQERLGAFFSKRMSLTTALGIPLSLAAGFFISYWKAQYPGYELFSYSILFCFGFIAGMLDAYYVSTIPEPRMMPVPGAHTFFGLVSRPFQDANYRNLVHFLGSWNFAVNLAAPFFTVYMLKRLELEMSVIIILLVLSQLMNLAFLRLWGRFSDRYSNKSVLGVSGPLFIFCILAWTFTTLPEKHLLTMPLLIAIHLVMGIATAGVTLSSGNIGLKLAPRGEATAYLAANSFVNSLAAGIAPILGGGFADFFVGRELSWTLRWLGPEGEVAIQTLNFRGWDFFFFLAFLIGLYSIHRLALVEESGWVKEEIVVHELIAEVKRPLRNFSTAGGLRHMLHFPFSIVRTTGDRAKTREARKKQP